MSWSREGGRSGPRGYHHGNLKEALIRAALELIARKGPAGFTFAEAARWAGVSPAAPYRHFRDRDELLVDVARRGFDYFEVTLARAWDDGRPDAFRAFDRLGKAYLHFAKSEPAYYSAMFEAGIPLEASPELQKAGERAFAMLRTATERLIASASSSGGRLSCDLGIHYGERTNDFLERRRHDSLVSSGRPNAFCWDLVATDFRNSSFACEWRRTRRSSISLWQSDARILRRRPHPRAKGWSISKSALASTSSNIFDPADVRIVLFLAMLFTRPNIGTVALNNSRTQELGYTGAFDGSAEMNVWLHKQVTTQTH
jgi:AcrR family transcriptional regulator